jgi:hypothetical protein
MESVWGRRERKKGEEKREKKGDGAAAGETPLSRAT